MNPRRITTLLAPLVITLAVSTLSAQVRDHGYWGAVLDNGASALLKDLKVRGDAR